MLSDSTILRASKTCTWRELAGGVIILQSDSIPPVTHELNSTSSFVWTELQEGEKNFSVLLESFLSEFNIDLETARFDLQELLTQLKDKKLLCMDN